MYGGGQSNVGEGAGDALAEGNGAGDALGDGAGDGGGAGSRMTSGGSEHPTAVQLGPSTLPPQAARSSATAEARRMAGRMPAQLQGPCRQAIGFLLGGSMGPRGEKLPRMRRARKGWHVPARGRWSSSTHGLTDAKARNPLSVRWISESGASSDVGLVAADERRRAGPNAKATFRRLGRIAHVGPSDRGHSQRGPHEAHRRTRFP